MTDNLKETQNIVTTQTYLIDCLLEIIDHYDERDWGNLGLGVVIDNENEDVYLSDFLSGEEHSEEEVSGVINPMGRVDNLRNPRESLMVYFYVCVTAMENKAKYERMRKEEDAKKARRRDDYKVGGTRRSRGEDTDNAERAVSDPRTRS